MWVSKLLTLTLILRVPPDCRVASDPQALFIENLMFHSFFPYMGFKVKDSS